MHHFLLTRFNLWLWNKDKKGAEIDRERWLEERLELFERFTLPSVLNQSCRDFEWVMLVDKETPESLKRRIQQYKEQCPQMHLVPVRREAGWMFAQVFAEYVTQRLRALEATEDDLCLTTYLDNDDCLHRDYVGRVQELAGTMESGTFIALDYGLQYFTELGLATRISYPNNHFISLVERVAEHKSIKTCYGYGSHFLLEEKGLAQVCHIREKNLPMWIEVIHDKNVDNDVKMTLDTLPLSEKSLGIPVAYYLWKEFGIEVPVSSKQMGRYLARVLKQMWRRTRNKIY